ncbi:MAG TPA: acyl-CoA dehydrogenase family protein [Solirubrobacteraceae bacterium]|jgi:cyclohexanecarboxyl-CoA dehydrogenase|nr:acyl-CoA dehydrogenase family protein [Solirubrobacteraceae bacterium]
MDFATSAEQDAMVQTARAFAERRLAPFYHQRELEGAMHRPTLAEMGQLGFLGVELPERYGGLGLPCLTAGLVLEPLCAADYNIGQLTIVVSLIGTILAEHGDAAVVEPLLRGMLAGETIPALALTEPAGGSDAAQLSLRARRDGDHYVLDGEKTSTTFITQADFAVVWARTGEAASGARGITAVLVPMDTPGITRGEFEDMGGRSVGRGWMHLDGVRVPTSHRLGAEGGGFVQVMRGFDYSRALIALQCLAVARQSLDETWADAAERTSFGRPLTAHQGVAFPLAEAETQLQACRLLCLETLWRKDEGLPHTAQAAMCKWWGPKLAFDTIQTCLLTHGHAGYSSELPYEQRLRDVLGLQIGDGTAQIMKLLIARAKTPRAAPGPTTPPGR